MASVMLSAYILIAVVISCVLVSFSLLYGCWFSLFFLLCFLTSSCWNIYAHNNCTCLPRVSLLQLWSTKANTNLLGIVFNVVHFALQYDMMICACVTWHVHMTDVMNQIFKKIFYLTDIFDLCLINDANYVVFFMFFENKDFYYLRFW